MNTIPDTILEQVCVMMNSQQKVKLTEDFVVPIGEVFSLASGAAYVSFTRDSPTEYVLASFQCLLKFVSKEIDPVTDQPEEYGYEDEYRLENVELTAGDDYIKPIYLDFDADWVRLSSACQVKETYTDT